MHDSCKATISGAGCMPWGLLESKGGLRKDRFQSESKLWGVHFALDDGACKCERDHLSQVPAIGSEMLTLSISFRVACGLQVSARSGLNDVHGRV